MDNALFFTKTGTRIPSIDEGTYTKVLKLLSSEYYIAKTQIIESASFSMAMVVRFALGLSSEGGGSIGIINDSLSGSIAAAAIRHLVNGGAVSKVLVIKNSQNFSDTLLHQLTALEQIDIEILTYDVEHKKLLRRSNGNITESTPSLESIFSELVSNAHNFICGVDTKIFSSEEVKVFEAVIDLLNDSAVPTHTIECPPGIHWTDGKVLHTHLFASSTMSLCIPLSGLFYNNDCVGRHYVCDISLPRKLLYDVGIEYPILFAEQPVIEIFSSSDENFQAINPKV
jgi:hypothetical protein